MRTVRVRLGSRSYPVLIGRGGLRRVGSILARRLRGRPVVVVSSARVMGLHGRAFRASLRRAGLRAAWIPVPDGEPAKTMGVLGRVLRRLARLEAGRDTVLVAFGGGTVGDLTGFAAAAYARGIAFAQIPTTLEAQVDAAIGGKTGVNLPEGKNLAGAFHQPVLVLSDPELLGTLPPRHLRSGLAEVVKYAVIASPGLFRRLERSGRLLRAGDARALEPVVAACSAIKARVVSRDEREGGLREILNFGHTIGHAVETAGGFRRVLHGEGVAIGMACAARMSARLGLCHPSVPLRIAGLLRELGLPVECPPGLRRAILVRALAVDKKRRRGKLRFVLTRRIGKVTVRGGVRADAALDELAHGRNLGSG